MSTAGPRPGHRDTAPGSEPGNETDQLLLERIQCGDEQALSAFYDRWVHTVYSVAAHLLGDREDAEEVVERTFSRIWRDATRYDAKRGGIASWIVVIARSEALSRRRGRTRRVGHDARRVEYLAKEAFIAPASPLQAAEESERGELIRRAVSRLPDEQRKIVRLTFFDGLSQTEIASALGVPLGTVKTRVRLAFAKLRASLAVLHEST
ncbi:MAG TPA: sigma-70 family RNA polymerase sigma factor [Longimicrobium sp.]